MAEKQSSWPEKSENSSGMSPAIAAVKAATEASTGPDSVIVNLRGRGAPLIDITGEAAVAAGEALMPHLTDPKEVREGEPGSPGELFLTKGGAGQGLTGVVGGSTQGGPTRVVIRKNP